MTGFDPQIEPDMTGGTRASVSDENAILALEKELGAVRNEARLERDRFWSLIAKSNCVVGEGHFTDRGLHWNFIGGGIPESRLGLLPNTIPTNSDELLVLMHPDDRGHYLQSLKSAQATGEPWTVTYRLSNGQGGWRWICRRGVSLGLSDGTYRDWIFIAEDITGQKYIEEELRKSVDELQSLKKQLQKENQFLREELGGLGESAEIIGQSVVLARVLQQVELVAATAATVLIGGETGTGKELVARAIHQRSSRQRCLFVAVNCAALPSTLVESELFGHEKGAFTGANAKRAGRFEQADKGTLFLDEVGELPLETQAKLLRVLQSGEYERVGGDKTVRVEVRIIAASNRDLEQSVREGRFRSDLYHRLAVFPINLPPLRDRREDIPLLAAYIVARHSRKLGRRIDRISDSVMDRLTAYDWPGNVRELQNVLERAIILSPGTSLLLDAVQLGSVASAKARDHGDRHRAAPAAAADNTLQAREREHIMRICDSTAWKIKGPGGAAHILGLNPGTLYSRMKKLGIRRPYPLQ